MEEGMENFLNLAKTSQQVSTCRKGGLNTMPFIIANEAIEKVASVGLHINMIIYLTNEYHLDNATGASILLTWGAVSNFLPSFGAFLSDAYLGRFRVIALGSVFTLLGLVVLWLTALIDSARPPHCNTYPVCVKPNPGQLAFLFSSFVLMAIGAGGIRPCSLAFGADQFDNPENPNNQRVLQSFFNWYYASVGISIMISITVIVYIQTEAAWVIGFGVPVGLMLFSTLMFFLGSKLYIKVKAHKSLMTSLARVAIAAWKNKHLALPPVSADAKYHHDKNSRLVSPTQRLRFLNKACIITNPEKDLKPDGSASDPWRLCTAQQVEEFKTLIKVLPIWSTGIIIAIQISNNPFPVTQARTMDRRLIGDFKIPASSFVVFGIITLTIWVAIYDRIIVPSISRITKDPRGLSVQLRMGIGLAISCLAMAVSALVERARRARAIDEGLTEDPRAIVNMSAMWLAPQHCLTGLAEALNAIGQIEFYYSQFPKSMTSIAVSLFSLSIAFGNLAGVVIVETVRHASRSSKSGISWLSDNLNKGHYDYYYWVVTILNVANFFYYLLCSRAYGSSDEDQKIWDENEGTEGEDIIKPEESPAIESATAKGSPLIFSA